MRAAKDGGAGEVIDGLEKNAREIDRIDTAEIKFITQDLVIEHIFDAISAQVVARIPEELRVVC